MFIIEICHTLDKYLDEDVFIPLYRSKTISVSTLLFQILLLASLVQFYECANELWLTSYRKNFSQCSRMGSPVG